MRFPLLFISLFGASAMVGQFGAASVAVPQVSSNDLQAIDVDADGDIDLVSLQPGLDMGWYPNADGQGGFGARQTIVAASFSPSLWALADVTGDGAPDAVFVGDAGQVLYLAVSDPAGTFLQPQPLLNLDGSGLSLAAIALVEVTGDGLREIVLSVNESNETSRLLVGLNVQGTFTDFIEAGPLFAGSAPTFILHGDIDFSGGNDLLVMDMLGQLLVLRNLNGDGSDWLADTLDLPNGMFSFVRPQLIDVDGDGDLDLAEARFPNVFWRENPLLEGGVWGPWTAHQLEPWTTAGQGVFGSLGCGIGAGVVFRPENPALQLRYGHWVQEVEAFSYRQDLAAVPQGVPMLLADFNGDGRDDLIMYDQGDALMLLNTIEVPVEPAILPDLPALCKYGNEVPLPDAQPSGGQWSGPAVFQNELLRQMLSGSGNFTLAYIAYEAGGCAIGDLATINVVEFPLISPFLGGSYCRNEAPIQLSSTPPGVTWYGIEQDGVFDPATFQGSFIVAEFVDVTGEACAAESFPILMQTPLPVSIDPVGPFCVNSGPQLITGSTVAFDYEWSGDIVSWNTSGAVFSPAQGPGTYTVILTANPSDPTQCPGYDTIQVVVNDQFPDIEISEIPVLCTVSGPVDLVPHATPPGGIWAGPGVSNGGFDPATVPAGAYLVTYTASLEGCLASQVASIKVLDEAEVTPSANLEICPADDPLQFSGFPEGGAWNAPLDANGQFDPSTALVGAYTVVYTWVGQDGCVLNAPEQIISVLSTTAVEIEPIGVLCDDLEAVPISGFPGGIWSGAAVGEGEVVIINPGALGPGQWPLTLTASGPGQCPGSSTVDLVVEVCTGAPELEVALAEAWPNPFSEEIVLRIGAMGLLHLELYDTAGRCIGSYGQQQAGGRLVLNQSGAMPGAYFLKLTPEAGVPKVLCLVKL
ncbi:MAG: VCBS repeat-containing protein [Flavobacteriales bacterium]|nr:VCBS repeat-containing protein [Flavobacteriales bacterium]